MRFEFVPVTSSMVGAVAYDADERELHVRFTGGQTYVYRDVPRAVYDGLLKAESVGRYLNANVKGRYQYRKGE